MSDIAQRLGKHIKLLRQARGLSQEQLAEKADLNTSFIGQIERGGKKPTIETLEKIVNALNITFEELFAFERKDVRVKDTTINDKISFLLNGLPIDEQEAVLNIIKQILKLQNRK